MPSQTFEMLFTDAVPPAEGGHPGFNPRTEKAEGMIIEYDVGVPMRDGAKIYIARRQRGNTPSLLIGGLMANLVV